MDALELTKSLSKKFFENGNYDSIDSLADPYQATSPLQAASSVTGIEEYFAAESGFSGLAVQSVGYTAGAEQEKVVIYLTKGSKKAISSVPKVIDGIPVDVRVIGKLKSGPFHSSSQSNSHFFEHNGRIACGSSCAPSGGLSSGTFGALVKDNNNMFALSNNHVFAACNHTPVGMPILSPASMDAKPNRRAPFEICRHHSIVEIRSGIPPLVFPMRVDAAIALVSDRSKVTSWQGDSTNGFDTPVRTMKPISGMRVKKVGRTTGLTTGKVEAFVPTHWVLPYKCPKFASDVWFHETWTVTSDTLDPFALPGDSGSLVVTEDGAAAIGLIFAVNGKQYGIFCDIESVLSSFGNISLVSAHGL